MAEPWLAAGALLVGLALGLWWGERLGVRLGYRLGEAAAPLELRRQSLGNARCLLCGSEPPPLGQTGVSEQPDFGAAYEPDRMPPFSSEC